MDSLVERVLSLVARIPGGGSCVPTAPHHPTCATSSSPCSAPKVPRWPPPARVSTSTAPAGSLTHRSAASPTRSSPCSSSSRDELTYEYEEERPCDDAGLLSPPHSPSRWPCWARRRQAPTPLLPPPRSRGCSIWWSSTWRTTASTTSMGSSRA